MQYINLYEHVHYNLLYIYVYMLFILLSYIHHKHFLIGFISVNIFWCCLCTVFVVHCLQSQYKLALADGEVEKLKAKVMS